MFSAKQRQSANRSGAVFNLWLVRFMGRAWREAATALSPGWSASRLPPGASLWSLFCCDCVYVWAPRLLSGRSRECCKQAWLLVSTYMPLFPKEGEGKKEKGKKEIERAHSSIEQNVSAGGTASPARFTDSQLPKTRLPSSPSPSSSSSPPPPPLLGPGVV